jgi:PAS domain S-box-containing protein
MLDDVFGCCPLASMVTDLEGVVRRWNPAAERMFGWPAAEIVGHRNLLAAEERLAEAEDLLALARGGTACTAVQTQRVTRSGVSLPVSVSAAPVTDAAGTVTGVIVLFADNRDRNRLEAQLVHVQRLRAVGQVVGGMAHDFNNLLTTMLGYCELLLEDLPSASGARADVDEIRQAATRAAGLTQKLLAFSRRQVLQPQVVDLLEIVADDAPALQAAAGPNVQVIVRSDQSPAWVAVDRPQVERALMNLTVNAAEAMPRGGTITIETAEVGHEAVAGRLNVEVAPGAYVSLAVTDIGEGMTPDVSARAFEPFFTTKGRGAASGLGLSAVYGIVKQSGGFIDLASQPGRGTTVTVWFPRLNEIHDTLTARPGALQAAPATILLVDDNPATRAETRGLLESLGYRVSEAVGTHEATGIAADPAQQVDLLVTNLVLPNMSGNELASRLCALRPSLPVLLISTGAGAPSRVETPASERTVFERPLTTEAIGARIRTLLGGAPAIGT